MLAADLSASPQLIGISNEPSEALAGKINRRMRGVDSILQRPAGG